MTNPRACLVTLGRALVLLLVSSLPVSGQDDAAGGVGPGGVPIQQPDCAAECDAILQRLLEPCTSPDGTIDPQCAENAKLNFDYDQCLKDCEARNGGGDPVILACQGGCYDAYAIGLEGCTAADGSIDLSCVEAKDIAFVECFVACGDVPWLPDLGTCAPTCIDAYRGAAEACRAEDFGVDIPCFKERRTALSDCLGACGVWILPLEDVCVRRCETAFQAAIAECGTVVGPNGAVVAGDVAGDEECAANAQRAFEACLTDCGITIPDEIRCAGECDLALKTQLVGCNGDAGCEKAALDAYTVCLEGCGIVVPPIPEPDPCVAGCEFKYQDIIGACFDQETGVVDPECLRRADTEYLACLEGCGVILPEPPPGGDPQCTTACDGAYREALGKCVAADGVADVECVAAADAAYMTCLESCGVVPVPIPGDPGFPVGDCEQACGPEILAALFDCAAGNGGAVDAECLARIGDNFNDCLGGCKEQAAERMQGALARTANQPFLRGDADLNSALEITDAIRVLSYLFLGSATLACKDAADSNDDGRLDIADVSALLGHLFLGGAPLNAPFDEPGADPTADNLGCNGR